MEIVAVIAIAAMLFQLVVGNMGAMIPARAMDAAASEVVSQVDWLRSESRLQGKTYQLELDLTGSRYRVIVPAIDRIAANELVEETFALGWSSLSEHVRFAGANIAGYPKFDDGLFRIALDENGFTADQAVYIVHEGDEDMVWTIQIRGLTGQANVVKSFDGTYHALEPQEEGRF